ncbi:hypothetical protein B0H13DRAFT_1892386 [Mycena leptocephala]|nr:hypothetical protein B0H13DRAFT_1892386 [Mycena leptocephala]
MVVTEEEVALEEVEGRSSGKEHGLRRVGVCEERVLVSSMLVRETEEEREGEHRERARRSGGSSSYLERFELLRPLKPYRNHSDPHHISPAGQTITAPDPALPDANQVGFAGPTPTGDEADAVGTAPIISEFDSVFPLVNPSTADADRKKGKSLATGFDLHLVQRHGARYPTTGAPSSQFATALHGLAGTTGVNVSGPLGSLATWEYQLGAEILTPFGRSQLFDLGVGFRVKYGNYFAVFDDQLVFSVKFFGAIWPAFTDMLYRGTFGVMYGFDPIPKTI